jgi:hypothetical protein
MHARSLITLVALALGITMATTSSANALEVDPQAPVVVDDSITLWPGGSAQINVLANDTDPAGDDLAVCRLPVSDLFGPPAVVSAMDATIFGFPAGTLLVDSTPKARGVHTIEYYTCNHTRLTPATLTVTIRSVAPVLVTTVDGKPGIVTVANNNDRRIVFLATDRTGCRHDAMVRVPAHESRTVRVKRHRIAWTAYIGRGGVADRGRLSGIELDGPAAPDGPKHSSCSTNILTGTMI